MILTRLATAALGCTLALSAAAANDEPSGHWRLEGSANAFRQGETIELGVITPGLFKFRRESRHTWSLFASAGLNSFSNALRVGETAVDEELLNLELIGGLFAHGRFYSDFLYQYGKIAVDYIALDDDIGGADDSVIGGLLESGLEFRSNIARGLSDAQRPVSIHLGLRWRFGFEPIEGLQGQPDPVEGISFVLGSRLMF